MNIRPVIAYYIYRFPDYGWQPGCKVSFYYANALTTTACNNIMT